MTRDSEAASPRKPRLFHFDHFSQAARFPSSAWCCHQGRGPRAPAGSRTGVPVDLGAVGEGAYISLSGIEIRRLGGSPAAKIVTAAFRAPTSR